MKRKHEDEPMKRTTYIAFVIGLFAVLLASWPLKLRRRHRISLSETTPVRSTRIPTPPRPSPRFLTTTTFRRTTSCRSSASRTEPAFLLLIAAINSAHPHPGTARNRSPGHGLVRDALGRLASGTRFAGRGEAVSFRAKLLTVFTLTVVISVGLVAWAVSFLMRDAFERLNSQRTDALVAQFQREFAPARGRGDPPGGRHCQRR